MGKLERQALQRGWCSASNYGKLKRLTWFDKFILWLEQKFSRAIKEG